MEKYNQITFGVGKEMITPAERTTIVGHGEVFGIPFKEVHDDIYARTLILRDADGEIVIFVTMDILFHDESLPEALRDYAEKTYNVPRENLHINYSHTHNGPAVKGYDFNCYTKTYEAFLFDRGCRSIDRAFLSMRKGVLKYATVEGDWNISRRKMIDGVMHCKANPEGERDANLYLLKLEDESGKMRALAVSFACHASNLDDPFKTSISSEYPGRLCQRLEGEFYGCTALFFQGFGADAKLKKGMKTSSFCQIDLEDCDEVALSMTQRIKNKLAIENQWQSVPVQLASTTFELQLPMNVVPLSFYENLKEYYEKHNARMMLLNVNHVIENYESLLEYLPLSCGVIRLNPKFFIYSMGGEPGVNIQTVLRKSMPDITLLCFGYNSAIAYVPSDKMIEEGGYEAQGSIQEYRLKGSIAPGVDKIYCQSLKDAVEKLNK